jgi:hypothetical protein
MNGSEIAIQDFFAISVAFQENYILEIQYVEKQEQTDGVGIVRQMSINTNNEELEGIYEELQDTLRDIVDRGMVILRNPPQVVRGNTVVSRMREANKQEAGEPNE